MPQVPQQELAVEEERTSKVEACLLAFSLFSLFEWQVWTICWEQTIPFISRKQKHEMRYVFL
jgi:hypothetical protein